MPHPYLTPHAFPDLMVGDSDADGDCRHMQSENTDIFPDIPERQATNADEGGATSTCSETCGEDSFGAETSPNIAESASTIRSPQRDNNSDEGDASSSFSDTRGDDSGRAETSPAPSASTMQSPQKDNNEATKLTATEADDAAVQQPSSEGSCDDNRNRLNQTTSLSETIIPGITRRTDFPVHRSKVALLVIDFQDYLSNADSQNLATDIAEDNSHLYTISLPRALSKTRSLVDALRKQRDDNARSGRRGCEVIFTYLEALTNDCRDVSLDYKLSGPKLSQLPGPSNPAKFLPTLQPSTSFGKGDIIIPKSSCSVFNSTNLDYVLRNLHIEQLILCGQLTDQCVESAARDAADLGYLVTVAEDACAATGMAQHAKGLDGMSGFARIVTSQQVLHELKASADDCILPLLLPSSTSASGIGAGARSANERGGGPDSATEPITSSASASNSTAIATAPSIPIKPPNLWSVPRDMDASGATVALLRALSFAGVKFLRYVTVDAVNSIRCKAVPIHSLFAKDECKGGSTSVDNIVAIAEACFAGLPSYADSVIAETNLSATKVLTVKPDLRTLRILPYAEKTAAVMGSAHDQLTGHLSPLCTRGLLARVMESAREEYGLRFNVGAELEFCLFKEPDPSGLRSPEPVDKSLFASSTTLNEQEGFISRLYDQLRQQEIDVELVHAESASGQLEIVLTYQRDVMRLADNVVMARETIRACARACQMRALFLPKISADMAGSGMHLHFSFEDLHGSETNVFPNESAQAGFLSARAGSFVEGILEHLPSLVSLTMPSINSFRRVGPGCWTGHSISWGVENKETPLRVCLDLKSGKATNVEYKLSDSTANIYLALASIMASGLQGLTAALSLRPMGISSDATPLPLSFEDSLSCLKKDSFLLGVLGPELSTGYIALRACEIEHTRQVSLEEEVASAYEKS